MLQKFFTLAIIFFALMANAQTLRQTQSLTSNNIILLAGSGDTLWLATERGFNYQITSAQNFDVWQGFEAADLSRRLWSIAAGGGGASALIANANQTASEQTGFWHFNHATQTQRERYFRFTFASGMDDDSLAPLPTGGILFSHGNFWAPFNTGGLVRYDPQTNGVFAIRPNSNTETPPQNLSADNANERRVISLDIIESQGESLLLITTPVALLTYNPSNNIWETLLGAPAQLEDDVTFLSYNAAFTIKNENDSHTLFSFMRITDNNGSAVALFRYINSQNRWHRVLDSRERFSIFGAEANSFHALFTGNVVRLYTFINEEDADENELGLTQLMSENEFRNLLSGASGDPNPRVNDILFLPQTNASGVFAVATTTGLYLWNDARPTEKIYNDFTLARHIREVSRGDAYALPGIIRSSQDGRYDRTVFVYRLKNDGNVTIRVYDYNMSLVKTVIRNEPRSATAQRSTVPERDFWDGTNESGRRVTPGVYYFRITSTGRERFNGKVIIAQ